MTQKELTHF